MWHRKKDCSSTEKRGKFTIWRTGRTSRCSHWAISSCRRMSIPISHYFIVKDRRENVCTLTSSPHCSPINCERKKLWNLSFYRSIFPHLSIVSLSHVVVSFCLEGSLACFTANAIISIGQLLKLESSLWWRHRWHVRIVQFFFSLFHFFSMPNAAI